MDKACGRRAVTWLRIHFGVAAGLVALFTAACALAGPSARTPHVAIAISAETLHPAPDRSFDVAIDIRPRPDWHIYWSNPGDAGQAPEAAWTLPAGFAAGPLRHPTPTLLDVQGVASNVHIGEAVLLDRVTPPAGLRAGAPVPIRVALSWLVCSQGECVPEQAVLDLRLAVGDGAPDPAARALFRRARAALPAPLGAQGRYRLDGQTLSLLLPIEPPPDLASMRVFLGEDGVIQPGADQTIEARKGGMAVRARVGDSPPTGIVHGVARVVRQDGKVTGYAFTATPGPFPVTGSREPTASPGLATFLLALAGAAAGGLVLNLMPCVFPILSLKALALARSGAGEAEARREAAGYAVGAVLTLGALGGALLALRAGGVAAGWAFQLQNPHVVTLLLILCAGIALNLAGLYELPSIGGAGASGGGFLGGAATGALAAFVATPCTGPFMAGALGAAMLLPAAAALAVFGGLGLGLALPFLAIGFVPSLRRLVPRPGAWMGRLRRLLSLPMFAAALALAWVLGREAGVAAMTVGLAAALILGLGLWWRGARQAQGRSGWIPLAPLAAAVALAFVPIGAAGGQTMNARGLLDAQPYTARRLQALRAERRPVFVYLTADWCLTCKVNEATSLHAQEVASAFSAAHVAVLEGDWTRGDPEVTRLLIQEDRAGVPLYLYYPVGGPPKVLPQVLTPSMLVTLARSA